MKFLYVNISFTLRKSYESEINWRRNVKNNINFIFLERNDNFGWFILIKLFNNLFCLYNIVNFYSECLKIIIVV